MRCGVEIAIQLFPAFSVQLWVLLQQVAEQHQAVAQTFRLLGRECGEV
ncbi:hypothetical protein SMETP3_45050 [Serratia marcescens]|nr:hypothetical protein SMETP3_45050 [Serratia marcescens]